MLIAKYKSFLFVLYFRLLEGAEESDLFCLNSIDVLYPKMIIEAISA